MGFEASSDGYRIMGWSSALTPGVSDRGSSATGLVHLTAMSWHAKKRCYGCYGPKETTPVRLLYPNQSHKGWILHFSCLHIDSLCPPPLSKSRDAWLHGEEPLPGTSLLHDVWICHVGIIPGSFLDQNDSQPSRLLDPAEDWVGPGLKSALSGPSCTWNTSFFLQNVLPRAFTYFFAHRKSWWTFARTPRPSHEIRMFSRGDRTTYAQGHSRRLARKLAGCPTKSIGGLVVFGYRLTRRPGRFVIFWYLLRLYTSMLCKVCW